MATCDRTDLREKCNTLPLFHNKNLIDSTLSDVFPELSIRERECLFLYSSGLTTKNIPGFLPIKHATVISNIRKIKEKYALCSQSDVVTLYNARMQIHLITLLSQSRI